MAGFIDVLAKQGAKALHVQQLIDAFKGTPGKGVPLSLTAVNEPLAYAIAIKNNDPGGKGLIVYGPSGVVLLQVNATGTTFSSDGINPASALLGSDSPAITTPHIAVALLDANGNEVVRIPATAAAVNDVTVINAATGQAPSIVASGDDANVPLKLGAKGTGSVLFTTPFALAMESASGTGAAAANKAGVFLTGVAAGQTWTFRPPKAGVFELYEVINNSSQTWTLTTPSGVLGNGLTGASRPIVSGAAITFLSDGANWRLA